MEINLGTLDDINFPEILYKYRNWNIPHNKRSIKHREVYMASPNEFEDEIDCKIPIRYDMMSEKQAEKFYTKLSQLRQSDISRQQRRKEVRQKVKTKDYKNKIKNDEYQKFYFEQYFQRIGILSLTAEHCLDKMWSKYANNHEGFCIGYNSKVLFEYLGGGGKVEYFDEIPLIMPYPIMSREEIHHKQVYFKERKWEFEKEYRTQKFWLNGANINNRQIKLPRKAFHSVILGKNMSNIHKIEIANAIKEHIGNIEIFEYQNIC